MTGGLQTSGESVRLADFISTNTEPILAEWVTFAESCGPAGTAMDLTALRDHALAMLTDIVEDLRTPQSEAQEVAKSKGHAPPSAPGEDTAAEVHGAGRAESGFTVGEMVSEYRALRASVIRLWTADMGNLSPVDVEDLMRFNEAIDQALAESISRYTEDIDRAREMFVAILGHDLRTPLGAVTMASQFMLDTAELPEANRLLMSRISSSSRRMSQMVHDLLDFTRGRLGAGIPIVRAPTDLAAIIGEAVEEMRVANPESRIQVTTAGELHGNWDAARLSQVVTNLLGNAVQHGDARALVTLSAQGQGNDVVLRIHNDGSPIPTADLPGLFSPFKRFASDGTVRVATNNLGLGLYIAERIVSAHAGAIHVRSTEEAGTLFTVQLPR